MIEGAFHLLDPASGETPVIVEVPHAGLRLDPRSMSQCVAPASSIASDADLYVDELTSDTPSEGATLLVAGFSRYVIDLNRAEDDYDAGAVVGGTGQPRACGLVWRCTTQGTQALRAPVPLDDLRRRMELAYRPYHKALDAAVERKLRRFGVAVVLSAHSMPTDRQPPSRGVPPLADVVIGSRGRTTARGNLVDAVASLARSYGWTVAHDDPYPGGETTRRLGKPGRRVHAIQVELARRVYMDEAALTKNAGFDLARSLWRGLVAKLGAAALG